MYADCLPHVRQMTDNCQVTGGNSMQRITIRLPEQQISLLEKMVEAGEFPTISEAIRDAVRELIEKRASRVLSDSDQLSF